jgi:uncharacterized RDD family membrane protein YckC
LVDQQQSDTGGQAPPPPSETQWTAPPPAAGAPVPGAAGFVYADVPNRAIAYIIDAIILAIISFIVGLVVYGIVGQPVELNPNATGFDDLTRVNFAAALIGALVSTAISGAYFVWSWTNMRASPGQKLLGMQVGNAADGKTLAMNQAITRWVLLGAPFGIASALAGIGGLGLLIGLAGLAWFIALLVTTAQSPTKQGLHDRYANTVVVKAARSVG